MDDTMNKRPSLQFYPGDWWRANDVKGCSMSTQGVWFNLLMAMWDASEQGKIRGTKEAICRIIGAREEELDLFLFENGGANFATVTMRNGEVTIKNRRMYDDYLERKSNAERQKRHREKKQFVSNRDNNANVTPPSSSSTSTSTSKKYSHLSFSLSQLLLMLILKRKPDFKKPILEIWAVHTDRMIRLDNRTADKIESVIRWCQKDPFWQNNILSTEKLRKQFDKLELQMNAKPKLNPKKCIHCPKIGVYVQKDDTSQPYWLCEDHKPIQKPLPENTPVPQMKKVPGGVDINDARREKLDALGVK